MEVWTTPVHFWLDESELCIIASVIMSTGDDSTIGTLGKKMKPMALRKELVQN